MKTNNNIDEKVVHGFGKEWSRFDQSQLNDKELYDMFSAYFTIFPWDKLPKNSVGFDLGCGSGRWAKFVAPKVGSLYCIDPSEEALRVAGKNLKGSPNCRFHWAGVDQIPLADGTADFGYSIGVLHHVPDTAAGIKACVSKLKGGAPFLLYLYYAFDNRPLWYRTLWRLSDVCRLIISRMPFPLKYVVSQLIALLIYLPLARFAKLGELMGLQVDTIPLSFYRNRNFYTMRTDALDRFGTKLEKRFTKVQILKMMEDAGLKNIKFSDKPPYWCAVGEKN
ncbi:MAG: class I SAM-dependent methyltransferase [Deltaproteobacteria bacterium]|nr:class I SAM-dependent methyltransferase [Deltaproteobacteria bacterium]MCL5276225.1 class I SAM-dependent methyltransferase [Deltaproteobacteria bacterium]